MIELSKDLRNWIKYAFKATGKSRQEIADEIGISFNTITKMTQRNIKVSAETTIKVLKYLNYPNLDRLKLEEKKIYRTNTDYTYNKKVEECIVNYGLSLTEAAKICGCSRQRMFSIIKENCFLTKNKAIEIINKITAEMERRTGQQA